MSRLVFRPIAKHGKRRRGRVSAQPTNGQAVLDGSIQITEHSPRRIGVDPLHKEIVIFMQHLPGVFHGFVVAWKNLPLAAQRILQEHGLVSRRGRIIKRDDEVRSN